MTLSSSRHAAPHPPTAAVRTPGREAGGCAVLLAVHESRRSSLRGLLATINPGGRLAVVASGVEATLQLARSPVDLLVLDLQLETGQPLALIHLLARFAPAARILAFGDTVTGLPIQPYSVHGWAAAHSVLSSAIAASRAKQAEASPP